MVGQKSKYLVGIDVGGTFTDLIFVSGSGQVDLVKVASDPVNLVDSIMTGIKTLATRHSIEHEELISDVDRLVHGSTVAANALLERNGARMGFLTTEGFRDTLVMRRMFRENMYDTRARAPDPLVTRNHIYEVAERVDRDGQVAVPLKDRDIDQIAKKIEKEGLESIGICFLFSFRNPKHERRVKQLLKKLLPDVYVSTSYEVCPEIRDYERACTTHLNAYLQPPVDKYLGELARRLNRSGLSTGLQVMESNGGVSDPKTAAKKAVNLLLSGPAGGIIGSAYWGGITGYENVISFDMGGTSCDISLIRDRAATLATPITSTSTHCKFEGWDVLIPFIDIHTIGSGGGSIAWLDEGGGLHVGPRSTGANPGPACYSKGGQHATVTDADVLLGYIDPDYYLGGEVRLNSQRARDAIGSVAKSIGRSVTEAADGIFNIVNANMINGIRVVSVERGYDPRDFSLLSFGGAGAVHASALIEEMGVDKVVIPQLASGFSAFGMLCTDLHRDFVKTINRRLNDVNISVINDTVKKMISEGLKHFDQKKLSDEIWAEAVADMRYQGQAHDIRVTIPAPVSSISEVESSFNNAYNHTYGYLLEESSIQLINLRVSVYKYCPKPITKRVKSNASRASKSLKNKRKVYFGESGRYEETRVYHGETFQPGDNLKGPAIVELATTTIVVRPGQTLKMDPYKNYVIGRKGVQL
jgi:N-methylhydantoinase A